MRYRIKKVTYKNNEVKYFAQYYKSWFKGWKGIFIDGDLAKYADEVGEQWSREGALNLIDLAEAGKVVVMTVEFENINR